MPCGQCPTCINTNSLHETHLCFTCLNNKESMTDKNPEICMLCVYPNCNYDSIKNIGS